jgi:hypothetical protein
MDNDAFSYPQGIYAYKRQGKYEEENIIVSAS